MSKHAKWYETFFDGLYAKVLAGQFDESQSLEEARTIRKLLKLRKGQRLLDCPCGLGRITFELAKMNVDVTGADLTGPYVRRARRRAKAENVNVRFIRCDMRELPFDSELDAVVNWCTSFGYFDDAGNLAAARAAFAALKPGGKFLIEVTNKSALLPRFTPGSDGVVGGVRVVSRRRWDARTSRVHDSWTMSKGGRTERRHLRIRVFNGAEMRKLLRAAGFRDIRLFGRWPIGRLTRHSRRMIAVARRPRK